MTTIQQKMQHILDNAQGPAARAIDKLPAFVQENIVKLLGYPFIYPDLDSFTKCLMAVQYKKGYRGFIEGELEHSRKTFELQMQSILRYPTAIEQIEDIQLPLQSGTISARHYHPQPNKKLPMIVFYHGGGFILGSLNTHDEACRLIAKHTNSQVMSIEYPLAPEASPSHLIQSCEDALAWVYQNRRHFNILKNKIAVAGDSAGGNISAVLAQRSVGKTYAPQAQFLIYPTVDFKNRHPSFYAYKDGLVLTEQDVDQVTDMYANQHHVSLDDPLISPTYGQLKKLAPAFIVTAGYDVLHDEAEIYSHKLRQNGVKVQYVEYLDQTHGFINTTTISSKAKSNLIHMSKNFRKFWDRYA